MTLYSFIENVNNNNIETSQLIDNNNINSIYNNKLSELIELIDKRFLWATLPSSIKSNRFQFNQVHPSHLNSIQFELVEISSVWMMSLRHIITVTNWINLIPQRYYFVFVNFNDDNLAVRCITTFTNLIGPTRVDYSSYANFSRNYHNISGNVAQQSSYFTFQSNS